VLTFAEDGHRICI